MSIIRERRLFWGQATVLLLVFLVIFTGSAPFISAPACRASSWAGWDNIDTIAILPTSDEYLDTAAQELKTYLEQMSSRSWTVVQGDIGDPAVRLDVNPNAPDFTSRGDEAVQILSDASGIRITGKTPMATRHGAYILLEKLGVRWFFRHPAWEVVPPSLVDPGAFNEVQEPSFFYRNIVYTRVLDGDQCATWNMRNRLIGSAWYPVGHNYRAIIDAAEEYAAHPDWFIGNPPDGAWQLNPENAEVIARAVQYARDELNGPDIKPIYGNDYLARGGVQISPRDGGGFDPPYDETDWQLITDKVFHLANEVAKVIGTEFPDKYISLYNYYIYSSVPTYDLEPNLLAWFTTSYAYTELTPAQRIDGLQARGCEVGIRDFLDVWQFGQDSPDIDFDHIGRVGWYGAKGARAYTSEGADGWGGRGGLTYYLVSKLLWNHNVDVDTLLDDFYTKAFGPAKQPMKHYFETRDKDDAALQASFQDLDEAESLAAGNDEILERIRYLEYYNRYLWLWHNKGITNLTLDELKDFYTFITKTRDFYIVTYRYVGPALRTELTNRGLTYSEIDALQDFTPPTAVEARAWLDEALAEFSGFFTPYINPRRIELQALGDTVKPRLPVMDTHYQDILVPSGGNEDVEVLVKGLVGVVQWYDPTGLLIDYETFGDNPDWVPVTFRADSPGVYTVHSTRIRPIGSRLYVDVPNRPASVIADPRAVIFNAAETVPRNAPSYWNTAEQYFYVPTGTVNFRFGSDVQQPDRPIYGQLTNPNDVVYPFNFTETTEMQIDSPAAGIWMLEINQTIPKARQFWLVGIPPLVWHDSEYLLVPATGSNSPPIADNQSVAIDEDTPINITLNASDPDGDPLTYAIVTSPSHGTLTGTPPAITYTPNPNFFGSDNFTFTASDGTATSNRATVTITVNPTSDPPVAENQSVTTNEDTPLSIALSASDPDGDPLTYTIVTNPSHGTLSGIPPAATYTPNADFSGSDSFTFTASDNTATSNPATVTITVNPVNNSPAGGGGGGGGGGGASNPKLISTPQVISTDEDTPVSITLSASDPDGDSLTYAIVTRPAHGTLSGTPPAVTYTPDPDFSGSDNFTFTARKGTATSNPATVTITVNPTNDQPVAEDQSVTVVEDTPVSITLSASDPDGDTLTYAITTGPSHGTLSGTPPAVTYTPNPDFNGSDIFTFTASDGTATSNPATVTITVNPTKDRPVAGDQSITVVEDTPVSITLSASDPDGDSLTYAIVTGPSHGTLSGTPPAVTYTPNPDFNGSDIFTFTASDGIANSRPATVTISARPVSDQPSPLTTPNSPPVANSQSETIDEDSPVVIILDASDPDGDHLTYTIVTGPSHGTLSGTPPAVTYTPNADFIGSDIFTFTASDGAATSNTDTVIIYVNPRKLALGTFFIERWKLGSFPAIFIVTPMLLLLALGGVGYRYARPNGRYYRKPQLRPLSASSNVLNSRKR